MMEHIQPRKLFLLLALQIERRDQNVRCKLKKSTQNCGKEKTDSSHSVGIKARFPPSICTLGEERTEKFRNSRDLGRSSNQQPDLHKGNLKGAGQGRRGEENSATNALAQCL